MHPNLPGLLRVPVFAALLLFSLIVLGVDAHLISKLSFSFNEFGIHYSYSAPAWPKLGVATAVLTLVTLLPFLVIDFLRKGAPTSWVVTELGWLGFLWILWLATAADTANNVDCNASLFSSGDNICSEAQAAEAFSFLAWIALMAYWVLLLVSAVIAHNNGNSNIWRGGVADADFTAGSGAGAGASGYNGGGVQQPVQHQQQMTGASGATYPPHNV